MKNNTKKILYALYLTPWLACASSPQSISSSQVDFDTLNMNQLKSASFINPSLKDTVKLGLPYNSQRGVFKTFDCISGKTITSKANSSQGFQFQIASDANKDFDWLRGSLTADLTLPVLTLSAGGKIDKSDTSNSLRTSYKLNYNTVFQTKVITPLANGSYKQTSQCKRISEMADEDKLQYAGDSFISALEYGASLDLDVTISFMNKETKDLLQGRMSASYSGLFNLDLGGLDNNEKYLKQANVSIKAQQLGGDPTQLVKLMADDTVKCGLDNLDPCFAMFKALSNYANTSLPLQLANEQNHALLKIYTSKYADSALDGLASDVNHDVTYETKKVKNVLVELMAQNLEDYARSIDLLTSYSGLLKPTEEISLEKIKIQVDENSNIISNMINYCNDNPYENDCSNKYNQNKSRIINYDRTKLFF